jgi:hypothetical protein
MRWCVALVSVGCISGRALSDDEQFPANDDGGTEPPEQSTLVVVQADSVRGCSTSDASMTALGREGAITVTHTGVELADCVAWIPTATLDGNEVALSYETEGDEGECDGTCPMDFGFTLEVPAGEYVVSWKDVEVDVVVR